MESFVDLTYRGLSLGRRIKLTQVRPSSGFLELPAPMPVGTHLTIATDDGVVLDATVTWIYEQIAGAEQTPGVLVAPALAAEAAAAWWKARVALPAEDRPRTRTTRNRPVTLRPRSQTRGTPPAAPTTDPEMPAIVSDLTARVTAAAGIAAPGPVEQDGPRTLVMNALAPEDERPTIAIGAVAPDDERRTTVMGAVAPEVAPRTLAIGAGGDNEERRTTVMSAVDQELLEQLSRPEGEAVLRAPDDHAVVDDGKRTVIMESIDPAALELAAAPDPASAGDDEAGEDGDAPASLDSGDGGAGDKAPAGGKPRKRRKRR